ncbi:MAG TPA: PQQ-binding-like beta-propeller repeat protein [Micromonosporaceae bacterium]
MDRIAVIDLGEVSAGQVLDDPPARGWPHRRWALVAVALGLVLGTAGGSAPVPRPLPMAVVDAPSDLITVHVVGDRIFVADAPGPGERSIAGYRLMDLEPLWRVDLPIGGQTTGLALAGDTLVLIGEPQAIGQPDGQLAVEPDIVGLDAATGATRWRHRGFVEGPTPGGRLLVSVRPAGPGGDPPPGELMTVRALSADTGDVVWSYDAPAGALMANHYDGPRVALLGVLLPTGRFELRDADTGQILRSGQIDVAAATAGPEHYVEIVGDFLVVRETSRVAVYGLDRLDLRWTIPVRPGQDGAVSWCGQLLCLNSQNWQGISALDPQTGRIKWSQPRWSTVQPAGEHLVAVESDPQRDGQHVVVIDPETGHARRDLGAWQGLDWTADSITGMRFDRTEALVARLDPARGVRVLGVLHDVSRDCWITASMLLCRRTDNKIGVWRLPE